MENVEERSARLIQKCFRNYQRRIKEQRGNDTIKSTKNDESSFVLLTENKSIDTAKIYEELQLFYQNLSANKSRRTYLATLLNDIDKNLSLLRNITSLDTCQRLDNIDKNYPEDIFPKAKDKHIEQLNVIKLKLF